MASRSQEKAEAAIKELKDQTGKEAIFLELDLSNLAFVRKAAEEFLRHVWHTSFAYFPLIVHICPHYTAKRMNCTSYIITRMLSRGR